jgi:L-2,4-diaminobutyrate transaminase
MSNRSNIAALDRASVLHPFTNLKDFAAGKLGDPTIVETGRGVRITDSTG